MKRKVSSRLFIIFTLLTGLICFSAVSCDTGEDETITTWDRDYSANSTTQFKPRFVFETSDGDFISYGGQAVLDILYTTKNGALKWSLSFPEIYGSYYRVYTVMEMTDGFLVSFVNKEFSVSRVMIDKEGVKTDEITIPNPDATNIRGLDASEESVVIASMDTEGDFSFERFSNSGDVIWKYDANPFIMQNSFSAIKSTHDGGAVVIGRRNDTSDDNSGCIARLDSDGGMAWSTYVNPMIIFPAVKWDNPKSIYETEDGGFIYTAHYGMDMEYYLGSYIAKISNKGNVTTRVVFPGNYANCAKQTNDKGYILSGFKSSFNVPSNDVRIDSMFIEKLNSLFFVEWKREYPVGEAERREQMFDVNETIDEGYITTSGYNYSSKYWLMKVNNKGNLNP